MKEAATLSQPRLGTGRAKCVAAKRCHSPAISCPDIANSSCFMARFNKGMFEPTIQEDDTKWDTFEAYKSSNDDIWVLYQGHVSSMKSWLVERMRWLKEQFDAM